MRIRKGCLIMSVVSVVDKIGSMFDNIDDIVYEPVKLLCDTIRQPLELAKDKYSQKLEMQLKQFEVDLEYEKKERNMKLTVEERRLNEEINNMIFNDELARSKEMIELEKQYRLEMAEAAERLSSIMASISVEAREKVLTLYTEKKKEYIELQDREKASMLSTIKEIKEIFSDNTAEISAVCIEQIKLIAKNSSDFSALLNRDMEKIFITIDKQTDEMGKIASKYFQPAAHNQPAITQNVIDCL